MTTCVRGLWIGAIFCIGIIVGAATGRAQAILADGQPDPASPDLRLWLRADAGVKDAAGRSAEDAEFSGTVHTWADRSQNKFDLLAAAPERAPLFVPRQATVGNQPVVSFAGRQMLMRPVTPLFDKPECTIVVVLQLQAGAHGHVLAFGQNGNTRTALSLPPLNPVLSGSNVEHWLVPTTIGEREIAVQLPVPADGRGQGRVRICWLNGGVLAATEYHDGSGEFLGPIRNQWPPPGQGSPTPPEMKLACNKSTPDVFLGGLNPNDPHFAGQIAEVIVFNRVLTGAERGGLLGYLRSRYGLDAVDALFPADAILLSGGDFKGTWQIAGGGLTGRMAVGHDKASVEPMQMTVDIPHDGKYFFWVRAMEAGRGGVGTAIQTTVQGKELDVTHTAGQGAVCWRLAGEVELKAGPADIVFKGVQPGHKTVEALYASPVAASVESVEEYIALAQRLRQMEGPARFVGRFENGLRMEGSPLAGWRWIGPDGNGVRPTRGSAPPLVCFQFDSPRPDTVNDKEMVIEFHNGDRLRGQVVGFQPASGPGNAVPALLVVRTAPIYVKKPEDTLAVEVDWVRSIVVDSARARPCGPQSLIGRDGRVVSFRSIRWGDDSVSLLGDEGVEKISLRDVTMIRLADVDPWEGYFRELAAMEDPGVGSLVRVEMVDGTRLSAATDNTAQNAAASPAKPAGGQNQGRKRPNLGSLSMQPVWCRTPIVVPLQSMRVVWEAPATVVPLSRVSPETSTQPSSFGSGWKWQPNRSVSGEPLWSGNQEFLWGFGVHAPSELVFALPGCARRFRTSLGIDAAAGTGGAAVGRIYLNEAKGTPLRQTGRVVGGGPPTDSGDIELPAASGAPRRLVLVADTSHDAKAPDEATLDLAAHVDWLEPVLHLDGGELRAEVSKRLATEKPAP